MTTAAQKQPSVKSSTLKASLWKKCQKFSLNKLCVLCIYMCNICVCNFWCAVCVTHYYFLMESSAGFWTKNVIALRGHLNLETCQPLQLAKTVTYVRSTYVAYTVETSGQRSANLQALANMIHSLR